MKLGEVLKLAKGNLIDIQDEQEYTIAGVQNNGAGILNRRRVKGRELRMRKYQLIKENQLMWCKVDTKGGAFGVTQKEHIGSLASPNMALAEIDKDQCLPEFLSYLFRIDSFHQKITKYSSGSTNRKYLTPTQLFEFVEIPNLTIDEQKKWINKIDSIRHSKIFIETAKQLALVKELRQAYLREAMQGKLVARDEGDEPAAMLLKRIKAEKEELVAAKKIKREKPLPPIPPEEIPFDIPSDWTWCRLGEICTKIGSGSTPRGSNYSKNGVPFFRSQNIYDEGLILEDITFISDKVHKQMNGTKVNASDILLNITGGSLGRAALVPKDFAEGNVSQHVCIIRPTCIDNTFLHKVILSPYFQYLIFDSTTGAGREGLPKYNLEQFAIPLPPLAEQGRIVAKLEKLLKACDELEANIRRGIAHAERLLQTALKEALEPK